MSSKPKEYVKLSSESAAHLKNFGKQLSDNYCFTRMQQWMDDGDKGITVTLLLRKFRTYPARAMWLLHKFYFNHRDQYDLKRSFYIEPEVSEEVDDKGDRIEYAGFIATEEEVMEAEADGEAVKKKLYSIHPSTLNTVPQITMFNVQRMNKNITRQPLSTLYAADSESSKKAAAEQKRKEEAKLKKLFDNECERPKHVGSPKGKNKYTSPVKKPKDDFFNPSPSKKKDDKDASSSSKGKRKLDITHEEPEDDPMMEDVFTTGDDDIEDIDRNTNQLVASPPRPIKKVESRYRPKKTSDRGMPQIKSDPFEDFEMEDLPATSSSQPHTMKELRTVQETTRDDEGYMVTSTTKKMVPTGSSTDPPPAKKKATPAIVPITKPKVTGTKQQTSLTDFFKKK